VANPTERHGVHGNSSPIEGSADVDRRAHKGGRKAASVAGTRADHFTEEYHPSQPPFIGRSGSHSSAKVTPASADSSRSDDF